MCERATGESNPNQKECRAILMQTHIGFPSTTTENNISKLEERATVAIKKAYKYNIYPTYSCPNTKYCID